MRIILASQSPRRKFMLEQMGLTFDTIPSEFKEYFDEKRSAVEVAEELAMGKALDVARSHPDAVVIGADSIVVLDNRQLGKPENAEVAKAMLRAYRNRPHQIITSVAVVCYNKDYAKVASDVGTIFFDELDEEFIEEYVAAGTMYDKAGGYALQDPMIRPHVHEVQGRYDTIIGLPTNLVANFLKEFDIDVEPLDLSDKKFLEKEGFFK